MAGEKSVGRLIGWFVFHVMGWRRFVSLLAAIVVGWVAAGCILWAGLTLYPQPPFPNGDPILQDRYLAPERWQSVDADYQARRTTAEADAAKAMKKYSAEMQSRGVALNITGAVGVATACTVAVIVYRQARRRLWREPAPSVL